MHLADIASTGVSRMKLLFLKRTNAHEACKACVWQVWSRFVQFEATYGDLTSLLKVEKRRCAALKEAGEQVDDGLEALVRRYRFMDLWPASQQELALIRPHQVSHLGNRKGYWTATPTPGRAVPNSR
jgi:hypothetical protein